MKTPLLVTLFFFSLSIPGKLFNSYVNQCKEWESFKNLDGSDSKLAIHFCNLSDTGSEFFEIKNDTELDVKLIYHINFKNGKNISNEIVIPLDDKVRIYFRDQTKSNISEIASWNFEKIIFKKRNSFKDAK